MKTKIIFLIVLILSSICWAKYSGGSGEPNEPYLIATPNDLNSIGLDPCDWDKHFLMTADINMVNITGDSFNIIGDVSPYFTGVFDGNNHTIYNFTFATTGENAGLFAIVNDANAQIERLTMINPNVQSTYPKYAGAIVVSMRYGKLIDCHIIGGVVRGGTYVGGMCGSAYGGSLEIIDCTSSAEVHGSEFVGDLIGSFEYGTIKDCSASGDVNGNYNVGGLLASNTVGIVIRCSASGNVKGEEAVGGLVGSINYAQMISCYATGDVIGQSFYAGGIAGFTDEATISNCYAAGAVDGNEYAGGFCGLAEPGFSDLNSCFWDSEVNPDVNGLGNGSDPNVVGLPTYQMQKRETFADAGWDMLNVWDIGENQTYPFLRMYLPSDINKDDETNLLDLAILAQNWLKN